MLLIYAIGVVVGIFITYAMTAWNLVQIMLVLHPETGWDAWFAKRVVWGLAWQFAAILLGYLAYLPYFSPYGGWFPMFAVIALCFGLAFGGYRAVWYAKKINHVN